ncbi:RNA polymerase sigma-70 factor [Chitinophaga sp. 212800010-3]|uniref:RNA polymerase sigma factor n=1 Tax=unclassified Chitinophaga TaxID=2619133 RepID=UPI002E160F46
MSEKRNILIQTVYPGDEQDLISEIMTGSQRAFEALFLRHKDRVYAIAFAYTESEPDAEEIVQDVFLRVWKNRSKLGEVENLEAWLYTVSRNLSLSVLKRIAKEGKRKDDLIHFMPSTVTDAESQLQVSEIQSLLQKALLLLSPQQRKVFELSRLKGMDRGMVAEALGLSPATVSVHLTIALRIVRAFLLNQKQDSAIILLLSLYLSRQFF